MAGGFWYEYCFGPSRQIGTDSHDWGRKTAVHIELNTLGNITTLALHGRFVFESHRAFRGAVERAVRETGETIDVDLAAVEHLDSAGLGMLLVLNDKARAVGKRVALSNSQGEVRDLLDVTRMERNFVIS